MHIKRALGLLLGICCVIGLQPQWASGAELIAYWPLDQNSGEEVQDVIGGHHGQLKGGKAAWVSGKFGNGLQIVGPGQYVEVAKTETLELEALTLVAWVSIKSPGARQEIVSYADSYAIFADSVFHGVLFNGGGWDVANGATPIQADTWYQAVEAVDDGEIRLYVNGVLDATLPTPALAFQDFPMWFGGGPADNQFWLTGILDEIEIWDSVLSDDEIEALFNAPPGLAVKPSPDRLSVAWGKLKSRR